MSGKAKKPAKPKHPLMLDGHVWDRQKVMQIICDQIATSSKGLGSILVAGHEGNNLPTFSTIMLWMTEDSALSDMYAKAKEAQADWMADELLEIADDGRNDWMERNGDSPGYALNGEHVQRSRLRVDTRKWLAAKLKPRKYGERVEQVHSGSIGLKQVLDDLDGADTGLPSSED